MSIKVGSKMLYCKIAGDKSSEEVVEVVAVQSEAQGGGVTIFIPSLKRERDTLIERLSQLDIEDRIRYANKEMLLLRKENNKLREENIRNTARITELRLEVDRLKSDRTSLLRQRILLRKLHQEFVSAILQNVNGVCYDTHSALGCVVRLTVQQNQLLQEIPEFSEVGLKI